ncbi:MAG TPA: phage holin family protein [Terracidiphilus sp.]|nr:phage holin family protein [Terracidiphilus sp.]
MFRILIQWLLSTIAMMIMMRAVPGFFAEGTYSPLLVGVGIGLANALLGYTFKMITFPLSLVLFSLFVVAANVGMIEFASHYVDGFYIYNIDPALWAGGVLTGLSIFLRAFMKAE